MRSERWRYIRYADGTEELYDHRNDPHEWKNLASDPRFTEVKHEHSSWLAVREAPPVPGSAIRLLNDREGILCWEGEPIVPGEWDSQRPEAKKPNGVAKGVTPNSK